MCLNQSVAFYLLVCGTPLEASFLWVYRSVNERALFSSSGTFSLIKSNIKSSLVNEKKYL